MAALFDPLRTVVPYLRDPAAAHLVLTHVRTRTMTRESGARHYLDPRTGKLVKLRGLTPALRALYWPNYSPFADWRAQAKARKDAKKRPSGSRMLKRAMPQSGIHKPARPSPRHPTTAQDAARGAVRGSIVHRQLGELALYANMDDIPGDTHAWTRRVHAECRRRQWRALAFEYGVYDEELGLGTPLDAVYVTPAGKIIFTELKTSASARAFNTPDATPMTGALAGLPNTARNRALIQLLVGVLMAVRGLGLRVDFEAWVIHVTDTHMDFIELAPTAIVDEGGRVYADMHARLPGLRAKKD
jgi:hypothetical protein